jgi:hypothetical protein
VHNQIDVIEGGNTQDLQFDPAQALAGLTFHLADDGHVGTEVTVMCFAPGTRIATEAGERAVEALRPGDLVTLADGTAAAVRWLGTQTVATRFADPIRVLPVRIRAGALATNLPRRDLLLSPCHGVLIDDMLVQAGALVNGESIVRETDMPEMFRYYHVELDRHALLLAEGVAAESFLDGVAAMPFDNAADRGGREVPDELPYPRIKAHRQVPTRLRAAIAARASEQRRARAAA